MHHPRTEIPYQARARSHEGLLPRIRARDVVRHGRYQLMGSERALRVPYDLFHPQGPVEVRGMLASYIEGDEVLIGRTAQCRLEDTVPGERVLVRLDATANPLDDDGEWWLCEIEAKDGVEGD